MFDKAFTVISWLHIRYWIYLLDFRKQMVCCVKKNTVLNRKCFALHCALCCLQWFKSFSHRIDFVLCCQWFLAIEVTMLPRSVSLLLLMLCDFMAVYFCFPSFFFIRCLKCGIYCKSLRTLHMSFRPKQLTFLVVENYEFFKVASSKSDGNVIMEWLFMLTTNLVIFRWGRKFST